VTEGKTIDKIISDIKALGFKTASKGQTYRDLKRVFITHPTSPRLFLIEYPNITISFKAFGFNNFGNYPRIDMAFKKIKLSQFILELEIDKKHSSNFSVEKIID